MKSNESNSLGTQTRYKANNTYSSNLEQITPNNLSTTKYISKSNLATSSTNKKVKTSTNIITTFVAAVSAVLIGTGGATAILDNTSAKATFESVYTYEDAVVCFVDIENFEEGMIIELSNTFTDRVQPVEESKDSHYYFEHLASNMYYTLEIKKGSKVLDSKKVYTKPHEDQIAYEPQVGEHENTEDSVEDLEQDEQEIVSDIDLEQQRLEEELKQRQGYSNDDIQDEEIKLSDDSGDDYYDEVDEDDYYDEVDEEADDLEPSNEKPNG